MRIDKLKLTNFKNFSNLKAEFGPGINLFVGINGSGKTALLDAVCVALGGFFAKPYIKEGRLPKFDEIKITDGTRELSTTVTAWSKYVDGSWSRTKHASGGATSAEVKNIRVYGEKFLNVFNDASDRTLAPLISFYSTQRLFKDASLSKEQKYDASKGRWNGYVQCLDEKAVKALLSDWMGRATTTRATKNIKEVIQVDNVLENVELALRDALISCLDLEKNFPLKVYQDADIDELVFDIGNHNPLPIAYYSDGYRNFIFLVMDMVWRASQLNPWLAYDELKEQSYGVVVIDEVDLHLHPKWQGKVIPILKALLPNVQFFITTHSPTVVANFNHGNLYIIDNEEVRLCNEKYFGKEVNDVLKYVLGGSVRHVETQQNLDRMFELIDAEIKNEELTDLLKELTELLGKDDSDIFRAKSLMEWNEYKKTDSDAVH